METNPSADTSNSIPISIPVPKTKISRLSAALTTASIAGGVSIGGDNRGPVVLCIISWLSISTSLTKTLGRPGLINRSSGVKTYSSADTTNSIAIGGKTITKIAGLSTALAKTLSRSGLINRSSRVKTSTPADTSNTISISKTKISWLSTALSTTTVTGGVSIGGDN